MNAKDPNDMHRAGVDLLKLGDEAPLYQAKGRAPGADAKSKGGAAAGAAGAAAAVGAGAAFDLVCLADVTPVAVNWLWEDRLARGHLTLLASDPGMGKSQLTIDF